MISLTAILDAVTDVTALMGNIFGVMTSNPLLTFFLAASLVGVGVGVFKRVKSAAR